MRRHEALSGGDYVRAAEIGDPGAQYELGLMYATGQDVPRDYVQAHMWFNLAAAHGDEDAKAMREELTSEMSPEEITLALRLARAWQSNFHHDGEDAPVYVH